MPKRWRCWRRPGEGSVRDSLSALDQAIACCGAKLNAAEVRALLGAFSLESLEQVTEALRRGRLARACSKWWTNWSATATTCSISAASWRAISATCWWRASRGAETRLVAASAPSSGSKLAEIAARFSEEDLTRYLQLSLDLFRDLQFSLQPRFHLEIGLLRLVQAGRLLPIEEALAGLGPGPSAAAERAAQDPRRRQRPRRRAAGPSPFETDRAKSSAAGRPPEPQSRPAPTTGAGPRRPARAAPARRRRARQAARAPAREGAGAPGRRRGECAHRR